jgi:methionyl-tRNA synthetase
MSTGSPKFYLTTAISYPNGVPHIGHAYELMASDAIARFKRLDGFDVFFLTGTDEHGLKMQQAAHKEGLAPRELADRNAQAFRDMGKLLNASNDDFIRTTEERHYLASETIWQRMVENGDIYLSTYNGWYSVRDEAYYDESETTVNPDGQRIGPQGSPVEWTEEETYFFKLSAYQDRLLSEPARLHQPGCAPQRGDELRQGRLARSLGQPHDLRLGHSGAGQPEARDVCLGRCPDQLHHRRRLSG